MSREQEILASLATATGDQREALSAELARVRRPVRAVSIEPVEFGGGIDYRTQTTAASDWLLTTAAAPDNVHPEEPEEGVPDYDDYFEEDRRARVRYEKGGARHQAAPRYEIIDTEMPGRGMRFNSLERAQRELQAAIGPAGRFQLIDRQTKEVLGESGGGGWYGFTGARTGALVVHFSAPGQPEHTSTFDDSELDDGYVYVYAQDYATNLGQPVTVTVVGTPFGGTVEPRTASKTAADSRACMFCGRDVGDQFAPGWGTIQMCAECAVAQETERASESEAHWKRWYEMADPEVRAGYAEHFNNYQGDWWKAGAKKDDDLIDWDKEKRKRNPQDGDLVDWSKQEDKLRSERKRKQDGKFAAQYGSGDTGGAWKAQLAGIGENVWSGNSLTFDTEEEAAAYAKELLGRWFGADIARVVPADTPNHDPGDPVDPTAPNIVVNYRTGSRRTASDEIDIDDDVMDAQVADMIPGTQPFNQDEWTVDGPKVMAASSVMPGFYRDNLEWVPDATKSQMQMDKERLFPDGIPLHGDLTPEQEAWLKRRSSRQAQMFPGAGATVYRNDAGEVMGWSDETGYEPDYDDYGRDTNYEEEDDEDDDDPSTWRDMPRQDIAYGYGEPQLGLGASLRVAYDSDEEDASSEAWRQEWDDERDFSEVDDDDAEPSTYGTSGYMSDYAERMAERAQMGLESSMRTSGLGGRTARRHQTAAAEQPDLRPRTAGMGISGNNPSDLFAKIKEAVGPTHDFKAINYPGEGGLPIGGGEGYRKVECTKCKCVVTMTSVASGGWYANVPNMLITESCFGHTAGRTAMRKTAGMFTYKGDPYGTGTTPAGTPCQVCGQTFDMEVEAYTTPWDTPGGQKMIDRWCGLDILRGNVTGSRRTAEEGQTCSTCGGSIERDPEGESNRTWHHNDGDSHDHEAKPGSKESRLVTAARPIYEVAAEIKKVWGFSNIDYAARPYLDAMMYLNTIRDNYGADSGAGIVAYFLGNASKFRGPDAKRLKDELRAIQKGGARTAARATTKFNICPAHQGWFSGQSRGRMAENFVEGGPGYGPPCSGDGCSFSPGTDLFDSSICNETYHTMPGSMFEWGVNSGTAVRASIHPPQGKAAHSGSRLAAGPPPGMNYGEWRPERRTTPAPEGVSQELWDASGVNAGLGVGHIWSNVQCPAYHTFDPADCICQKTASLHMAEYESQSARDAQASGYGQESYWQYLDDSAREHRDYWTAQGDSVRAEQMMSQSLSDSLRRPDDYVEASLHVADQSGQPWFDTGSNLPQEITPGEAPEDFGMGWINDEENGEPIDQENITAEASHAELDTAWNDAFAALNAAGLEADADDPIAQAYRDASDAINHLNRQRDWYIATGTEFPPHLAASTYDVMMGQAGPGAGVVRYKPRKAQYWTTTHFSDQGDLERLLDGQARSLDMSGMYETAEEDIEYSDVLVFQFPEAGANSDAYVWQGSIEASPTLMQYTGSRHQANETMGYGDDGNDTGVDEGANVGPEPLQPNNPTSRTGAKPECRYCGTKVKAFGDVCKNCQGDASDEEMHEQNLNNSRLKRSHLHTAGERCGAQSMAHIGNQVPMTVTCFLQPGHDGPHKDITLDSDDNAITYTWQKSASRHHADEAQHGISGAPENEVGIAGYNGGEPMWDPDELDDFSGPEGAADVEGTGYLETAPEMGEPDWNFSTSAAHNADTALFE